MPTAAAARPHLARSEPGRRQRGQAGAWRCRAGTTGAINRVPASVAAARQWSQLDVGFHFGTGEGCRAVVKKGHSEPIGVIGETRLGGVIRVERLRAPAPKARGAGMRRAARRAGVLAQPASNSFDRLFAGPNGRAAFQVGWVECIETRQLLPTRGCGTQRPAWTYFHGLTDSPSLSTSRWTWGPVERPVEPISAILSPRWTRSPCSTVTLLLCP